MRLTYSRQELIEGIQQSGIKSGDIISLQVSLGRLGLPEGLPAHYTIVSNFVIDAFLEVLGESGTLIVPTYTYSIGKGEVYEVETTPSRIGDFTEVFRKRSEVRSRDPMLSSAGIGPASTYLLRPISNSCYGKGSTFHRLRKLDTKICTLGVDLYYATFRHHIEEMANVPFRFLKQFSGIIRESGEDSRETWEYFAAPYVDACEPNGQPLTRMVQEAGLVGVGKIGRGEIKTISAREFFDFGVRQLKLDPWLTAKGPADAPIELFGKEPQWLERNRSWLGDSPRACENVP